MKILLIFHHGWGLNGNYFFEFEKKLKKNNFHFDFFHFDSCYFSEIDNYEKQKNLIIKLSKNYQQIIGIGQSIGFIKLILLTERIKFSKLISIAGFLKFINSKNDLKRLEKTIIAFNNDPTYVLKNFQEKIFFYNKKILLDDLEFLKNCDLKEKILSLKNVDFFHLYQKKDSILGDIKSINNQLNNDIFIEFELEGNSHFYDIIFEKKLLDLITK